MCGFRGQLARVNSHFPRHMVSGGGCQTQILSTHVSAYNYETSVLEDSMSPRHSLANTQTHVTKISKKKKGGGRSSSHPQVHRLSETQEAEMNASFVHVTGAGGEE